MRSNEVRITAIAGAVVVAVILGVVHLFSGLSYTDPGFVGIVRNGGAFDNTQIRRNADGSPQIVQPGSSYTWIGAWSSMHSYPATSRYWTIDSDGGGDSNQTVNVPTRDGVNVGAEGQFTFALNTEPAVLADFDNRFGTRGFGEGGSPSDGTDEGWNAFLGAYLPATVTNALRQEIGNTNCRDLVASCSLVQNNAAAVDPDANTQANLQAIQERVSRAVEENINANLGGPFIRNVQLSLSKVNLPADLQARVEQAQGAFAAVSEAQARIQQAEADARANETRQRGYNLCPSCAEQDVNRSLPVAPGYVYAPGAPVAVGTR
jgi:hypothetical protein